MLVEIKSWSFTHNQIRWAWQHPFFFFWMKMTRKVHRLSSHTASSLEDQCRSRDNRKSPVAVLWFGVWRWAGGSTDERKSGGRRSAAMKSLRQGRVQKEVMMSVTVLWNSDHLSHCLICCCLDYVLWLCQSQSQLLVLRGKEAASIAPLTLHSMTMARLV